MFLLGKKKKALLISARQVADEFFTRAPPAIAAAYRKGSDKKAKKQFSASLENAVRQVAQLKANEHLGIYGKAKLHQVFATRLKELGYPDEVADEINSHILIKTP